MRWTTTTPDDHITAPDGSEIRLLLETGRASTVHCTLPRVADHWPVG